MDNLLPQLRALNFWTLKQKIKDHTIQRVSTIQLLHRIDIYEGFTDKERAYLQTIEDPKQQQEYIRNHGKLTKTTGNMKSHSFTLQFQQIFIEYVAARLYNAVGTNSIVTVANVRDTSNTLRLLQNTLSQATGLNIYVPALNATTTITTYGILAGTGATPPATADYTIQTLISHGVAAGKLQYQATSVGSSGVVGANVDTIIVRVLVNGSGGTVTITEVGMVTSFTDNSGSQRYFLVVHDAVNQAVATTEVAVVSYDFRTTV